MQIDLAAVHEAGHAVMQWVVGWELKGLHMTVRDGNATEAAAECPKVPLQSRSAIRKRLVVLFSGNDATRERWPTSENNQQDWYDALGAIHAHCQRKGAADWVPSNGYALADTEANDRLLESMIKTKEIVKHPAIRKAIDRLADVFAKTSPDAEGRVFLSGTDAVSICEEELGKDFLSVNPWSDWLAGQ